MRNFVTGCLVLLAMAGTAYSETKEPPKKLAVDLGGGVKLDMTLIPAGEFMMGSQEGEKDWSSGEGPQHRVRITKPFYMGVYEVTQEEYERVMGSNPSDFASSGSSKERVAGQDTRRFPVENVSWNDAVEFCQKLSQKEGKKYRLPTEAEWEYACRGGTTTPFSFGSVLNGRQANCDGNNPYGIEEKGPYLQRTTMAGSYQPNAFGLYDMHGNVWEWCADWYDSSYYAASPVDDPSGSGSGSYRVLRGGGWYGYAGLCRSANRDFNEPGYRHLGFRVSLVPAE